LAEQIKNHVIEHGKLEDEAKVVELVTAQLINPYQVAPHTMERQKGLAECPIAT